MAVPTFDKTLAVHITVNATEPKAPQREGAGCVAIAEGFWSALKLVYSLALRLAPDVPLRQHGFVI
jgi:hypothetical protein